MERHDPPFLLTGIPILQRLLTGPAWRVFLVLAGPGAVMVLLSIPFGVASIPATHTTGLEQNLGFLYRHNWTWPYMLVVPASLLLLRHLSRQIRNAVTDLEEMGVLVQTEQAAGRTFVQRLGHKLERTAGITVVVCVAGTLVFLVFDTLELVRGYYAFARAGAATGLRARLLRGRLVGCVHGERVLGFGASLDGLRSARSVAERGVHGDRIRGSDADVDRLSDLARATDAVLFLLVVVPARI